MFALLRYHYRDPRITRKLPERELLRLFAEMGWIKELEAKQNTQQT